MRPFRLLAAAAALAASMLDATTLAAQPAPSPRTDIAIGWQTALHSAALGETRPVMIHLPPSYAGSASRRYPVLFLLDGEAHFATVSTLVDFLAGNNRIPELIVVAIPNTRDRTHDLTPPAHTTGVAFAASPGSRDSLRDEFPTAGGATAMRRFLTTELAPWVDTQFRTVPYRILVGHSFGGLFAIDALAAEPRAFNTYVSISPSLWWDGNSYVKRVEQALANASLDGVSLYMTTGGRESNEMIDPARELATTLDAAHHAGFRSWYALMPNETHNSNPLRSTYDALEHVFAGWEPPDSVTEAAFVHGDLRLLDAHNAALSREFGYPVPTPPEQINQAAYANLRAKRVDVAVALFRRNSAQTPDYVNGWDSLADGLEAQGSVAEAIAAEEQAVKRGIAQKNASVGQYVAHLARLRATKR